MIEANDLCKSFGAGLAVDHLTLSIQPGEVFCLLGANGAGKTTTINLFLNFIPPTSGHARIGGLDVVEHPVETKKRLAYIPEQVTLYRNLTGLENLRFFSRLAQATADSDDELLAILAQVGLTADQSRRRVHTYSKGMRQKVGIAITIAKGATALLLDEPTSGLDPKAANDFSVLLERPQRARRGDPDGDARPVSRQGVRHAGRHHEARPPGRVAGHETARTQRSGADLPASYARLIRDQGSGIVDMSSMLDMRTSC